MGPDDALVEGGVPVEEPARRLLPLSVRGVVGDLAFVEAPDEDTGRLAEGTVAGGDKRDELDPAGEGRSVNTCCVFVLLLRLSLLDRAAVLGEGGVDCALGDGTGDGDVDEGGGLGLWVGEEEVRPVVARVTGDEVTVSPVMLACVVTIEYV